MLTFPGSGCLFRFFATQPEHQLNLSRAALEALIGAEEASRLWQLPRSYRRQATIVAVPPPQAAVSSTSAHQMVISLVLICRRAH